MPTISPKALSGRVREFCRTVNADSEPVFVPVVPAEDALARECFPNVARLVEERGGALVYGWAMWMWPNVYIEAEHHAVWRAPGGALLDPTPTPHGEDRILFVPDLAADYDFAGNRLRDNIRRPLTSDPAVADFLAAAAAWSALVECHTEGDGRLVSLPVDEARSTHLRRQRALGRLLDKYLRPDDPCTCGSGRPVKKCCGLAAARRTGVGEAPLS